MRTQAYENDLAFQLLIEGMRSLGRSGALAEEAVEWLLDLRAKVAELDHWKRAAETLGESLADIGPSGYYDFTPEQWLIWAQKQLEAKHEAVEPVAENGEWTIGKTDEGKYYVESSDFTHDVRLYLDGDFESGEKKYHYCGEIIRRLNQKQSSNADTNKIEYKHHLDTAESLRYILREICEAYSGGLGEDERFRDAVENARRMI